MVTIEVKQSLSTSEIYEHISLESIKKLCKFSGKFDNQQHYKAILGASMVSIPEGFTESIPMSHTQYVTVKNPSARKSLRHFLDTFEVKPKTNVRRFCDPKSKCKAIISGSMLWSSIPKTRGHSKIN